jgi:predicted nucleotidyltransferase component of viral defense system
MITQEQIKELSKTFQIDNFTLTREYLQLVFLNYLFQEKEAKKIYFKGGTALRFFFGSPRFSEDLDFSTTHTKKQIRRIVEKVALAIQKEIASLKIIPLYSGKKTERFRIKYEGQQVKYPLVIRLDFHRVKKIGRVTASVLSTKFPIVIFPLIPHLTEEELLKEKIEALASRCKGRDFFDVWYLLEKGVPLPKKVNQAQVLEEIKQVSPTSLRRDLNQFLPSPQREIIKTLKSRLQNHFL